MEVVKAEKTEHEQISEKIKGIDQMLIAHKTMIVNGSREVDFLNPLKTDGETKKKLGKVIAYYKTAIQESTNKFIELSTEKIELIEMRNTLPVPAPVEATKEEVEA